MVPKTFVIISSARVRDDVVLAAQPHTELLGVFTSAQHALERLAEPIDLIITDIDALRSIDRWRRLNGGGRVPDKPAAILVLDDGDLRDALGFLHLCQGILFWQHDLDKLRRLIVITIEGYCGVPANLLPDLITDRVRIGLIARLGPAEQDTLRLLGEAMSNRSIARTLGVPEAVAKSLVRSVLTKLRLKNRTEAAVFAVRWYSSYGASPNKKSVLEPGPVI